MILSDADIQEAISSQRIIIDPPPGIQQYQTSSLDLRIGHEFFEWSKPHTGAKGVTTVIDFDDYDHTQLRTYLSKIEPDGDGKIHIKSEHLYLVQTLERINLPLSSGLAARVEGRSGLARLGVSIHQTAPVIHCGFNGTITLEILNLGPFEIKVIPGVSRLCQLVIEELRSAPDKPLETKFQEQDSPSGKKTT